MAKNLSKRLKAAWGFINKETEYSVDQALELIADYRDKFAAKCNESVDVAVNLGINPKKSDQNVKGFVSLPSGTGKTVRLVVFCDGDNVALAKKLGAVEAGAEDLIQKIKDGWTDFDKAVATPSMMPKLAAVAKVLGPKGLMPNAKLGTVGEKVEALVNDNLGGRVEFRSDKFGSILSSVGKLSFDKDAIKANLQEFVNAIKHAKPSTVKSNYFKSIYLSTTMGIGIKLNLSSVLNG